MAAVKCGSNGIRWLAAGGGSGGSLSFAGLGSGGLESELGRRRMTAFFMASAPKSVNRSEDQRQNEEAAQDEAAPIQKALEHESSVHGAPR
jgi:hypothetical protein